MQFNIPIGDWSHDGHSKCDYYLCETDATIEQVREVYFDLTKLLGFKFDDVCGDYEERTMQEAHAERLVELGLISEKTAKMYVEEYVDGSRQFASILVDALNLVDPNLNIKMIESEKVPNLTFYGFDEQKRHIGHIGYGLFY